MNTTHIIIFCRWCSKRRLCCSTFREGWSWNSINTVLCQEYGTLW